MEGKALGANSAPVASVPGDSAGGWNCGLGELVRHCWAKRGEVKERGDAVCSPPPPMPVRGRGIFAVGGGLIPVLCPRAAADFCFLTPPDPGPDDFLGFEPGEALGVEGAPPPYFSSRDCVLSYLVAAFSFSIVRARTASCSSSRLESVDMRCR